MGMKRIFIIIAVFIIVVLVCNGFTFKAETNVDDIAKKLIRFHVIANSDNKDDQSLKLKVRDEVLHYMAPKLQNSKSVDESRKIIKENDAVIKKIAQGVVKENNYNYKVTSSLSMENFPIKSYGNIVLPEGKYEAYRIIIGKGSGQNWWCVMFPPLCFVDVTVSETNLKKADDEMKQNLTKDEYKMITENNDNIIIKFKIVEIIKKILKKCSL